MSTFRPYEATCPTCAHRWTVEIARGLHITRIPRIREELVQGTFQVFTCPGPGCGRPIVIEDTLVFTDFERNEYVAVETAASASWQAAVARHQTVFRNSFENGPPIAQEWGATFKRRIVFGFRGLREKIVVWDAGLDDRIVEAVKGDLLREQGESPRDLVLRVSRVLEGGHLLFSMHESVRRPADATAGATFAMTLPPPRDFVTAPAARYAARAASPSQISVDYPWIHDDWLVDLHHGPSYLYV